MYAVSNTFHTLANADKRKTYLKVVYGNTTYTNQDLVSFTFQEAITENNISMGNCFSNNVVLCGYGLGITLGATFTVSVSFDNTEWCPLGTFKVSDYQIENGVSKVTAYDAMAYMTDTYPASSTQTTINAVVSGIATGYGITVKSNAIWNAFKNTTVTPIECTDREQLGYMAGLMGANAVINRDGQLEFRWFSSNGKTLTNDLIVKDGKKKTANSTYTVGKLVSGTNEEPIEYGSGYAINFSNPYMTQAQLNQIGAARLPFTFQPIEITDFGNPAYEVGDIITVDSLNVPIMSHKIEITGILNDTLISYGLSEEKALISLNVGQEGVERKLTTLQEIVQGMSDSIGAGRRGYVVDVMDGEGANEHRVAIRAMDTPTVTPTTKGLEINSNGIGWSEDGFTTFIKTILDMANGKLYADQIVANSILSNTFYIGLNGSNYAIKFDGATGNLIMKGNIYRKGATDGTDDFLIGINDTPNLQVGSALQSSTDVYADVNIYSNDEIRFMVAGAKTGSQAKVIINNNGTLELKTVPSETTTTNAILCIDSSGNVCNSGKTIADIGSGGGGQAWIAQSSAPSDTTKIWIDTSTGYKIPKIYYGGSWVALNATFG